MNKYTNKYLFTQSIETIKWMPTFNFKVQKHLRRQLKPIQVNSKKPKSLNLYGK